MEDHYLLWVQLNSLWFELSVDSSRNMHSQVHEWMQLASWKRTQSEQIRNEMADTWAMWRPEKIANRIFPRPSSNSWRSLGAVRRRKSNWR
jgi:hypothetical protein